MRLSRPHPMARNMFIGATRKYNGGGRQKSKTK